MRGILALPALALLLAPVVGVVLSIGGAWPPGAVGVLARGLGVAALATTLAVAVGAPAALGLRHLPAPLRAAVLASLALPWIVPQEVLALALAPVAGLAGGMAAVILAGSLLAVGPVTVAGWLALRRVGEEELKAAVSAGAGPGLILRRLLLPRLARGIAAGAALGLAVAAGQAAVPARLGPPGWRGLPALIPDLLRDAGGPEAVAGAAVAALLALLVPLLALGAAIVIVRGGTERSALVSDPPRPR